MRLLATDQQIRSWLSVSFNHDKFIPGGLLKNEGQVGIGCCRNIISALSERRDPNKLFILLYVVGSSILHNQKLACQEVGKEQIQYRCDFLHFATALELWSQGSPPSYVGTLRPTISTGSVT